MSLNENGDDTYEIAYSVPNTGTYEFAIKYDDVHITGSPFVVKGYSRTHPEQIGTIFFYIYMFTNVYIIIYLSLYAEIQLFNHCYIIKIVRWNFK